MRRTSPPRDRGSAAAGWAAVLVGLPAAVLATIGIIQLVDADEPDDAGVPAVVAGDQDSDDPDDGDRDDGDRDDGDDGGSTGNDAAGGSSEPDNDGSTGSGCEVVVANPLVVIHEQTDVFSQEVSGVPAGTYPVVGIETVSSPIGSQRWFRISVAGRSGWLRDSSFDIASKSAACP